MFICLRKQAKNNLVCLCKCLLIWLGLKSSTCYLFSVSPICSLFHFKNIFLVLFFQLSVFMISFSFFDGFCFRGYFKVYSAYPLSIIANLPVMIYRFTYSEKPYNSTLPFPTSRPLRCYCFTSTAVPLSTGGTVPARTVGLKLQIVLNPTYIFPLHIHVPML